MRARDLGFLAVALFAVAAGCSEAPEQGGAGAEDHGGTTTQPAAPSLTTEPGTVGMALELPADWNEYARDDRTDFRSKMGQHFSLWTLPAGTTAEQAVADAAGVIAGVVTDFEAVSSEDAEVAGAPARHVLGTGVEADDGDPSKAELYVFTAGGRLRLACVHGEGGAAEALRPTALAILGTLKPQ